MYISATGMICPVGLNVASACAAMRAGIANFQELPYYPTGGELAVGAMVPGLAADFENPERLVELLSRALADCLQSEPQTALVDIPLLVGLAERGRPGGAAGLADSIISRVEALLGVRFHPGLSRVLPNGHTAGFEAIHVARDLFQKGDIGACLVCGVDSYINADAMLGLEQYWRLKTENNSDGVIPGEAAAAVLVRRDAVSQKAVKITGLGFAVEKVTVLSEEPFVGLGLAEAARAALHEAGVAMQDIAFRISDVTGEQYGFKEQVLTVTRLIRIPVAEPPLWHCADSIGDTGAAAGVCQLVIADHAFTQGYAPGDRAMCFSSSIPGERGVLIVERQR